MTEYSSDESDAGLHRPRGLSTIEEMPTTVTPAKSDPPIDRTYESGLDLISTRFVCACLLKLVTLMLSTQKGGL